MNKTGKKNPITKADFHEQLRDWFHTTNESQVGPGQSQHVVIRDNSEFYRFDADTKRPAVQEYLTYADKYGDSIIWQPTKSAKDKQTKIAIGPNADVMSSLYLYHLPSGKGKGSVLQLGPKEADESPPTNEEGQVDHRQLVLQLIRRRRGNRKFRDALRKRYHDTCVVTGCRIVGLLEAAHIRTKPGIDDNSPENGLLLRADIHTLFDLNLIRIEPDTLNICLDSSIKESEYAAYDGQPLRDHTGLSIASTRFPSRPALRERIQALE